MKQQSGDNANLQNDDLYLLNGSQRLTDDASTILDQTHHQTMDTRISGDPILASISYAYNADSRIDSSLAIIDSLHTDRATSEIYSAKSDTSMPSSPLPSSSPQIFSSSSLPSSQSSLIEYQPEVSLDLKEGLGFHKHPIIEPFVDSENTLDVSLSYPSTLEISCSADTKHLSDLSTCKGLLNDDGRRAATELESRRPNVELNELNIEIHSAPLIPFLNNGGKPEGIEEVKADKQTVSMHEDSILQSSPSENSLLRVHTESTRLEETIAQDEKAIIIKSKYSTELEPRTLVHVELPLFELESRSLPNKRKIDENTDQMAVALLKKPKYDHAIDSVSSFPTPKRPTVSFQQLQHKKLISPFRSPALTLDSRSMSLKSSVPAPPLAYISASSPAEQTMTSEPTQPLPDNLNSNLKHRTQRASAPFKSPLSTDAITKLSAVRMTPTIQTLERKVQLLRRAIKIKDADEEETLLKLAKKWTEAGRDIAWEVWDLVKENAFREDRDWPSSEKQDSRTLISKDSWCWNDETHRQEKERNWGWVVESKKVAMNDNEVLETSNDDNEYKQQNSVGTMLVQMGIAPDTLGWSEEDEEFQDM